MRRTRAMGAAATMFAILAAAGCGGGSSGGDTSSTASHPPKGIASGEPAPPQSSTASSSPASKSPTTKPTSKSTAAGAPGVPEPARQHTKAGATAFAKYFYSQINALYQKPALGTVENLSLSSCTFCNETSKNLKKMAHDKQTFDGPQITVKFTKTEMVFDRSANVFMTLHQLPVNRVDANGNVVETISTMTAKSVNILKWVSNKGWRIEDVEHE